MYLVTIENDNRASSFIQQIEVDQVYPLSIAEGLQTGEVFADDLDNPSCYLYWHYCGFAYLAGEYDEAFICEIKNKMHHPSRGHSGRLALEAGNDKRLEQMLLKDGTIQKNEQYLFEFKNPVTQNTLPEPGVDLLPIDSNNYEMMSGRIVPAFSWESKEQFLKHGFGYCLMNRGKFAACAFSAGISEEFVDIGVETAQEYRGKGYGKIVVSKMIEEILRRGKTPVWQCHVGNEISKRLAVSQGFQVRGVHPLYKWNGLDGVRSD